MARRRNISTALRNRETTGSFYNKRSKLLSKSQHPAAVLFPVCPRRLQVPLHVIFDAYHEVKGCIILGFTKDGYRLISYRTTPSVGEYDEGLVRYSMQLWHFDLHLPLKKLVDLPLFGETSFEQTKLIFSQSGDSKHFFICATDRQNVFHASLIQHCIEGSPHPPWAVSLSVQLQPPFPPVSPSLILALPNAVILDVGDGVLVLRWETCSRQHDKNERMDSIGGESGTHPNMAMHLPYLARDDHYQPQYRHLVEDQCRSMLAACRIESDPAIDQSNQLIRRSKSDRELGACRSNITSERLREGAENANGKDDVEERDGIGDPTAIGDLIEVGDLNGMGDSGGEDVGRDCAKGVENLVVGTCVSASAGASSTIPNIDPRLDNLPIPLKVSWQLSNRKKAPTTLHLHEHMFGLEPPLVHALYQVHPQGDSFLSLQDYTVHLVDVDTAPECIYVLVDAKVLVQPSQGEGVSSAPTSRHVTIMFQLLPASGQIVLVQMSSPEPSPTKEMMNIRTLLQTWRRTIQPQGNPITLPMAWANTTVFTGKSLTRLQHPQWPVALVL